MLEHDAVDYEQMGTSKISLRSKRRILSEDPNFQISLHFCLNIVYFYFSSFTPYFLLLKLFFASLFPSHDKGSQSCEICYTKTIIASWSISALNSLKLYKNFRRNRP
jgi:hypothetical protein